MTIKTRSQLRAANAANFPDNVAGAISPADLRGQMDDVVDSAKLQEDVRTMNYIGSSDYSTIAIGDRALGAMTPNDSTTYYNMAIGTDALANLAVGVGNLGIGPNAGILLTSGQNNVVIGSDSLSTASTVNNCTVVGAGALVKLTSGDHNTAIGPFSSALLATGTDNTIVGYRSLPIATTGSENTSLGAHALFNATGCSNNTAIGSDAGLNITTGSGNTLVGYGVNASTAAGTDQVVIGRAVTGTANSTCTIGAGTNTVSIALNGAATAWSAASDLRLKESVEDFPVGLSFIEALRPVTFNWRTDPGNRYAGFIAQEVKDAIDATPGMPDGQHLWSLRDDGIQALAPGELIPILVNAIRELAAEIAILKDR